MGTVHALGASREAATLGGAVTAYLAVLDHPESAGTRRVYGSTLRALLAEFGGSTDIGGLRPAALSAWFSRTWGGQAPATWNRNRDALRGLLAHCEAHGWLSDAAALSRGIGRRRRAPDRSRALSRADVEALLTREDIALRERVLWRLLYETAARSAEVLRLDVGDLDLANRRAKVRRKGGVIDVIVWQTEPRGYCRACSRTASPGRCSSPGGGPASSCLQAISTRRAAGRGSAIGRPRTCSRRPAAGRHCTSCGTRRSPMTLRTGPARRC